MDPSQKEWEQPPGLSKGPLKKDGAQGQASPLLAMSLTKVPSGASWQGYAELYSLKYMLAEWEEEVDSFNSKKLIKPAEAHHNLLAAIQNIRARLPLTTKLYHVKEHQDTRLMMVLIWDAWMNIEMDANSKDKAIKYKVQKGCTGIQGELWGCSIHGRKLIKNIDKQLREHMHNKEIMEYWKKKQRIQ